MVSLTGVVLGPLAGPECRRATSRGWLILVRALAALAILGVALIVVWYWWINQQIDLQYLPYAELRVGLAIIEGMAVTIALVMGPALLAGTIAGEKERGTLGLLLTTRVSAREIVTARLAAKWLQVAMVLLASAPALILLGALAGLSLAAQALLGALPLAVALGGGGLAVAASTVSRRSRDALLGVYLLDMLFLLVPLASYRGWFPPVLEWLAALNPYGSMSRLVWREETAPALVSVSLWLALGLGGVALASWRLVPSCLAALDGATVRKRGTRRGWVPPLDDRPMLWKELYIERVGTLGRFGRWLGIVLVAGLGGGSAALAAVYAWSLLVRPDPAWAQWASESLTLGIGHSGMFIAWLIEWAVGLRAAVAIASERERGTWDALLTSPLSGREIVWGKLAGGLYALRWVFAAALFAWTAALGCGAMDLGAYAALVAGTLAIGAFMAAVGVRTSLSASTAARAMSWTIAVWLVAHVVVAIIAGIVIGLVALLCLTAWAAAARLGLVVWSAGPWFPISMSLAWPLTTNAIYVLATVILVGDTSLRFDRIAGRMTEGKVAVALDRVIYGQPVPPVPFGEYAQEVTKETKVGIEDILKINF
jgi:ABC-type transport system involved in multi-copper enzyme maturation permease subunit